MELIELNNAELVEISGGSELSEAVCYAVGAFFGFMSSQAGTIKPSEYR